MLVSLFHLPADGLRFEHRYEAGELDLSQREFTFLEPPVVKGRITRIENEISVKGNLTALLECRCDRCLTEVSFKVDQPFDLFYLPEGDEESRTEEKELQARDLDFSVYRDEQIDIDEMALEQVELSLPTRLLCAESCRGLCAQCGANLNLEQCDCQEPGDPRWQVLEDLRK